jgi:hypothetical protein
VHFTHHRRAARLDKLRVLLHRLQVLGASANHQLYLLDVCGCGFSLLQACCQLTHVRSELIALNRS